MKLKMNINITKMQSMRFFSVAELMFIMNKIVKFLSEMECQLYQ